MFGSRFEQIEKFFILLMTIMIGNKNLLIEIIKIFEFDLIQTHFSDGKSFASMRICFIA